MNITKHFITLLVPAVLPLGLIIAPDTIAAKEYDSPPENTVINDLNNDLNNEPPKTLDGATGSAKVLAIRVGFSDMPLSETPADDSLTTENIRAYFEGNGAEEYPYESIPGFYKRSSYDKLSLSLGEIIDVELPGTRESYACKSGSPEEYSLIEEIISRSGIAQKLPDYDADGDGTADFIYFFCNGLKEDKGSVWWPHCHTEGDDTFTKKGFALDDYVISCKEETRVLIHETAHFFSLPDYYSYNGHYVYDFCVPDMMNDNTGDHTGFSKWMAGWIEDEDIVYVDAASAGDEDVRVELSPVDDVKGDGKRIAVISREPADFFGEYFIAEYISGKGNMSMIDGRRDYPSGFRIIHVYYNKDEKRFYANALTEDHSVGAQFGVFEDGEEITPYSVPSTDYFNEGKPELFSGISITDILTGESPAFTVSFEEEEKKTNAVSFQQSDSHLSNMLELTLNSDRPLWLADNAYGRGRVRLEREGVIYPVILKADEYNATKFYLEYRELKRPLLPDTGYRLVIPEGTFKTETGEETGQAELTVKTGSFTRLENIESLDIGDSASMRSGLLPYGNGSAYIAYTGMKDGASAGFSFVRFDAGGLEPQKTFYVNIPDTTQAVTGIEAFATADGNFCLALKQEKNTYVQKISGEGELLSDTFVIPEIVDIIEIGDTFKGISTGTAGRLEGVPVNGEGEFTGDIWTFDLKNKPERKQYRYDAYISGGFFAAGDERYCISGYDRAEELYYTDLYDKEDVFIKRIVISKNLPLSFCSDGEYITAVEIAYDAQSKEEHFIVSVYDMQKGTFNRKRVGGENLDEMYFSGVKLQPADWGYAFFYRYSGKTDQALSKMMFLDKDFKAIGSLSLPGGADCIPRSDRVVVVWEDDEGRSMAWTEVLMTDVPSNNSEDRKKRNSHGGDAADKETKASDDDNSPQEGKSTDAESHTDASRTAAGEAMSSSGARAATAASSTGDRDNTGILITAGASACAGLAISVYHIRRRRSGK